MPSVVFSGSVGRLEGVYSHNPSVSAPLAVVLHPNSLQGGTMNNKVVCCLYKAFAMAGFSVLRFNFRGVGASEGFYSGGIGELSDAMSALDWLHSVNPGDRQVTVAGYSFGALIAMQLLMRRPEISAFVSVCPPVNVYDFSFLAPCPVSGLIVNGDNDAVCPPEQVEKLVDKLNAQKGLDIQYHLLNNCNHSFCEHIPQLGECVMKYLMKKKDLDIAV